MSFLQHFGSIFRKILHIGEEAAVIAEPFIAAQFPMIVPIYTQAIGLALGAESTAVAATGTGPQKLAQVLTSLVPQAQTWAKSNGINWPDTEIKKWTSALVDTLNMIPGPTATGPAPATAPAPTITLGATPTPAVAPVA